MDSTTRSCTIRETNKCNSWWLRLFGNVSNSYAINQKTQERFKILDVNIVYDHLGRENKYKYFYTVKLLLTNPNFTFEQSGKEVPKIICPHLNIVQNSDQMQFINLEDKEGDPDLDDEHLVEQIGRKNLQDTRPIKRIKRIDLIVYKVGQQAKSKKQE